jgi:carboxylesterase type B
VYIGVYVNTPTGKVRGQIEKTIFEGIKVQKFINIPYAEAPVGKLRFMKPEPKNSWKGKEIN